MIEKIKKLFHRISSLERKISYLILFILFFVLLIPGVLITITSKDNSNPIATILYSIAASLLASVISMISVDLSDAAKKEETIKSSFSGTFWLIRFYTLNFNFEFVHKLFEMNNKKFDNSKSSMQLFDEAIKLIKKINANSETKQEVSDYLNRKGSYYLRIISSTINNSLSENSFLHHLDDYKIPFMDLNQYIEAFLTNDLMDNVIEDIANILELLMNLEAISNSFEVPVKDLSSEIILYDIFSK